jgi:DNA-binding transcriptional ArsR family regulator
MNAKSWTRLEARARITKAMAHPARLMIYREFARGERCVQELTEMEEPAAHLLPFLHLRPPGFGVAPASFFVLSCPPWQTANASS